MFLKGFKRLHEFSQDLEDYFILKTIDFDLVL